MATTKTQREQIILTARNNPQLKRSEIAEMHDVTPNTASSIICRAKKKLGENFYLNGEKPVTNTSKVLAILEKSPCVSVASSKIERATGLNEEQVRAATNHMRNAMGLNVTRSVTLRDLGLEDSATYLYEPTDNNVAKKMRFVDVFALMNKAEAA